ncbi:hypothetical protein BDZ90DRAFT_233297 [Jaminaea rosea]|uniref:Uncharacterized protein n=1 Tax=Jaminaea rosea TaxID=1569628 RepID=A0A316ULI1_9BASI|nr:hypothetical protein BDZ90DRAFT_233297 [Jaminaea rosea]PWN26152.1 hypothetical protein BDZ90DRAFT_233297 [Jaminaea rosea]
MAIEPMDTSGSADASSSSSSSSSSSATRIIAAGERLASLLGQSSALDAARDQHDNCVAFSESHGLVAFPMQSGPAVAIAIKPLLAPSPTQATQPLLLYPPLLPLVGSSAAATSYLVRQVAFSPSGSSLTAIIQPRSKRGLASSSSAPSPYGLVCIWSRNPRKAALNSEWALTGQWPLLEAGGQLGSGIVGLHWLREEGKEVLVQPPDIIKAESEKVAPTTQLPGMSHEKQGKAREQPKFRTMSVPDAGPTLSARSAVARPEALVLVSSNGFVHLLHRNVSIYSQSPALATQDWQLLSAPLHSPATVNYARPVAESGASGVSLSHCTMHPVSGSSSLIIAVKQRSGGAWQPDDGLIHLTEVVINTKRDDPLLRTKPVQPIHYGEEVGSLLHLRFNSTLSGKHLDTESIHLLGCFSHLDTTGTTLRSYSLTRRRDISGKGSLSEAFGDLESRKKSLSEVEQEEVEEWSASLHAERIEEGKVLHQLVGYPRALLEEGEVRSKLVAIWSGTGDVNGRRRCERGLSTIDPARLGEDDGIKSVSAPSRSIQPDPPVTLSANGSLRGWYDATTRGLRLSAPQAPTSGSLPRLAAAILQAIINKRTYADVLLASSSMLRERRNRAKLLSLVGGAFGLDMAGSTSTNMLGKLNFKALAALLELHVAMLRVLSINSRPKLPRQELVTSHRLLAQLHTFRSFSSARQGADDWKPLSVTSLTGLAAGLIEEVEDVCRYAVLQGEGMPQSPPEDDAAAEGVKEGGTTRGSSLFTTLAQARSSSEAASLTLHLLTRNLKLLTSLLSWLDKACASTPEAAALRSTLVSQSSARLINEVKGVKLARKVARMEEDQLLANGGGGGPKKKEGTNGAAGGTTGKTPGPTTGVTPLPTVGGAGSTPLPSLLVPGATSSSSGATPLFSGLVPGASIPTLNGLPLAASSPIQATRPPLGAQTSLALSARPAAALTRRLAVVRETLSERLSRGTAKGVNLDVFASRLESWVQGGAAAAGEEHGIAASLVYGAAGADEGADDDKGQEAIKEEKAFARHVLHSDDEGEENKGSTGSVISAQGRLSLFLGADDFVWSLDDIVAEDAETDEEGEEAEWQEALGCHGDCEEFSKRDTMTGVSQPRGKKRRRLSTSFPSSIHLLTGETTHLTVRDSTMSLAMETLHSGLGPANGASGENAAAMAVEEDEEALRAVLEGDCGGDEVRAGWEQRLMGSGGWWMGA